MAHELEMIGEKASMAYFGETPWHNLGTPLTPDDRMFCFRLRPRYLEPPRSMPLARL
jgi:hypothetical protein